jgi:transcriptional regulator with GAF, ATPase, and Fis domain
VSPFLRAPRVSAVSSVADTGANLVERLREVCCTTARTLSGSGAGVSVMARDGVHGMAAASDRDTERLEELQFTYGEGPCIDAFATRRPVLVPDLTDGVMKRWPAYAPAVHGAGVRAVFAFPLQVGSARLGVLDLFRTQPGVLSTEEIVQAVTLADLAVVALLGGAANAPEGSDGLDGAIENRAELFQAQGMVMVQLGVTITEAMVRIRAHAYAENRRLSDVAADIIARRLIFERP